MSRDKRFGTGMPATLIGDVVFARCLSTLWTGRGGASYI